jgi:hypothetical protein
MNQVAGRTAGNAVDVRESIDHLTDRRGGRFPRARGHARPERGAAAPRRRRAGHALCGERYGRDDDLRDITRTALVAAFCEHSLKLALTRKV